MPSKWLAVDAGRVVDVAGVSKNLLTYRGSLVAEYFRTAATTKSKFIPTLSGREQRVREGATDN